MKPDSELELNHDLKFVPRVEAALAVAVTILALLLLLVTSFRFAIYTPTTGAGWH